MPYAKLEACHRWLQEPCHRWLQEACHRTLVTARLRLQLATGFTAHLPYTLACLGGAGQLQALFALPKDVQIRVSVQNQVLQLLQSSQLTHTCHSKARGCPPQEAAQVLQCCYCRHSGITKGWATDQELSQRAGT
jgi:hypothetical protein